MITTSVTTINIKYDKKQQQSVVVKSTC